MNVEDKVATFEVELSFIHNEVIREFAKLCIGAAPDYLFYDCPASSTGKFHPMDELSGDGTVIHTKKVFTLAYELSRGLDVENHRDEILAACLIHDLMKQGKKKAGHTATQHPKLAAELVEEVQAATQMLSEDTFSIIRNCVLHHYGPWSMKEIRKPLKDYSMEELCVYVSDFVASKRPVQVNYRR